MAGRCCCDAVPHHGVLVLCMHCCVALLDSIWLCAAHLQTASAAAAAAVAVADAAGGEHDAVAAGEAAAH